MKTTRRVVTIKIEILPDAEYDKLYGVSDKAQWEVSNNTVSLRESRHDGDRYEDFLHEMRHVYTDYLAPERRDKR